MGKSNNAYCAADTTSLSTITNEKFLIGGSFFNPETFFHDFPFYLPKIPSTLGATLAVPFPPYHIRGISFQLVLTISNNWQEKTLNSKNEREREKSHKSKK